MLAKQGKMLNNNTKSDLINTMEPYTLTVFLEDTDASGYVYHARYLQFMERARTTALYHKGIDHAQMISQGSMFVVTHCAVDYKAPAKLADVLTIHTSLDSIGPASITLNQTIATQTKMLVKAKITLACIFLSGSIKRIPLSLIQKLKD